MTTKADEDTASLVDHAKIAAAEDTRRDARAGCDAATRDLDQVQRAFEAAKNLPEKLLMRAAAGDVVTDADILLAYDEAPRLAKIVEFRRKVIDLIWEPRVQAAEAALPRAKDAAALPVLEAAIARRISAVQRAETAAKNGRTANAAEISAAKAEFTAATSKFIGYVLQNSRLLATYAPPAWQTTSAAAENQAWVYYRSEVLPRRLKAA